MAASPVDIARFTKDGVVITVADEDIRDDHPDAVDEREVEIEMFFTQPSDGQAMLAEKHALRANVHPVHLGVEVDERLDLGGAIPLTPTVPCFQAVDALQDISVVARLRALAYELGQDRFSVEVIE